MIDAEKQKAVQRAKASDVPQCIDWPRTPGSTTVYRLVEKVFEIQHYKAQLQGFMVCYEISNMGNYNYTIGLFIG